MQLRPGFAAAMAIGAIGALGGGVASAQESGSSIETHADFTPIERFDPLTESAECEEGGDPSEPFILPDGYKQRTIAVQGTGGTKDLWDMNTQNESGKDAGRYIYRTHEVGAALPTQTPDVQKKNGSQVTVTDLQTRKTTVVAERADWERFDGIVWTPQGTILAAEETTKAAAPDREVPKAQAGLVYELYLDPSDPTKLDKTKGGGDGIAPRPGLGSKSHEGMRFDRQGNHYGISEVAGGGIFRFVPTKKGDLSSGKLQALKTSNGRTGEGEWVDLDQAAAQVNADVEAGRVKANGYERPEDVETGTSTGRDAANGGNTLYVAVTGSSTVPGNVFAVDLSSADKPFIYAYAGPEAGNADAKEFRSPDNLALDSEGNLAITEDPGGNFTRPSDLGPNDPPFVQKTQGDDIWIAREPRGVNKRRAARQIQRFATLTDCDAEPTGIYFSGAENEIKRSGRSVKTTRETLFVNQQHAGPGDAQDRLVAITPSE